jgi:hypothetical protein
MKGRALKTAILQTLGRRVAVCTVLKIQAACAAVRTITSGGSRTARICRRSPSVCLLERPQVVAVELPVTLESVYLRAVQRLPSSLLLRGAKAGSLRLHSGRDHDPFIEAIRSAQEIGAEVFFVDPDVGERPHLDDDYPDTYAVRRIGYAKYVQTYRIYPQPRSFELSRHAAGIAWKLQSVDPLANVLVVISLNLLDPVLDAMQQPQAEPLARTRRHGIQVLNLHPDCLAEVLTEFPLLQSVYEVRRYGLSSETDLSEPEEEVLDHRDTFQVISTPKQDAPAARSTSACSSA